MSNVGLVLGLIAVGVVDGVLIAVLAAQLLLRPFRGASRPRPAVASLAPIDHRTLTALGGDAGVADGVPIAAYDRVARITGWAWILSTGILVSSSGLWADRQGAIFVILGIAGLFVLVAHDVLPGGALGRAKYLVEGGVSIVFVTLIVLLTGGASSPFFFAFVLIVVGAALVVPPAATVALAVLAAASTTMITVAAGGTTRAAPTTISTKAKKNGLAPPPVSSTMSVTKTIETPPSTRYFARPRAPAGRRSWATRTNRPAMPRIAYTAPCRSGQRPLVDTRIAVERIQAQPAIRTTRS